MPFVELSPLKSGPGLGTGVRVSLNDHGGFSVSVCGDSLLALGGAATETVKVLLDWNPACPMLRLVAAKDGPFRLGKAPLGDRVRIVRIGHREEFGDARFKSLDCVWEAVAGGIDIELPREMRATVQTTKSTMNATGEVRTTRVTLPDVGRVKTRV